MPTPSNKCNTTWIHSKFIYDHTGKEEEDGIFDVYQCDPQTGEFTGLHDNSNKSLSGTCQTTSPHISLTREEKIGRKTYIFTYTGDIDGSGPRPTIVRGRFKKVQKVGPVKLSNDDGDWTAQGPVTFRAKSRKSTRRKSSSKSTDRSKR